MVAFVPSFVAPEGAGHNRAVLEEARRLRAEHPDDPDAVRAAMEAWWEATPDVPATVAQVADHVDHIRDLAGVDHIGMGSDFDGAPTMPEGLDDVSRFPALFAELAERGYSDEDLVKIAGRNVLRVMREAERTAARLGGSALAGRGRSATGPRPRRPGPAGR
jgi:membrane dipeptidase